MLFVADLNMQDGDERALDLRDKLVWGLLGLVMITVAINLVKALLKDTKKVLRYLRQKLRTCLRKAKKDIAIQK